MREWMVEMLVAGDAVSGKLRSERHMMCVFWCVGLMNTWTPRGQ